MLAEPFATALDQALAFCHTHTVPFAVIASGTIMRGTADANSDLDIYVLHASAWRQRVQRWFNGVPCEIFINSPAHVAGYFQEENASGRPITAHMLATGLVLHGGTDARLIALREQARVWLSAPPTVDEAMLTQRRYMIATAFEDARDVIDRDPATALLLLSEAVPAALNFYFLKTRMNIPRGKELMLVLAQLDPTLAAAAHVFLLGGDSVARFEAAMSIADRTIGARGFFEWETDHP